ncbi:MAG: hypothetical protein WA840_22740 [Caulobacteraceae bacterium]
MSDRSKFDALLAEIGMFAKAMPTTDDAAIATAAGAGEDDEDDVDETDASDDPDSEDEADALYDAPMGKSFTLRLEDGSEVSAVDGAALVKALADRQEVLESKTIQGLGALAALVKSLQASVGKLSRSAPPRKSVITVVDKPAGATLRPDGAGLSGDDFMAKALSAQLAGRITGRQVAIAEQYLNAGQTPPDALVRAVLS